MTLFADPLIITLALAVFAALSATGTSLVIGFHFEKLRRQTSELQSALQSQAAMHGMQQKAAYASGGVDNLEDESQLSAIITKQQGDAARLLNGHDPSRHVRFV